MIRKLVTKLIHGWRFKYAVRFHINAIYLLISGLQYLISSLYINKLTPHGMSKNQKVSLKLMLTQQLVMPVYINSNFGSQLKILSINGTICTWTLVGVQIILSSSA